MTEFSRPLVTLRVVCEKCGSRLTIKTTTQSNSNFEYHIRDVDSLYGMDVMFNIAPCKTCIENETKAARKLSKAIAEIMESGE